MFEHLKCLIDDTHFEQTEKMESTGRPAASPVANWSQSDEVLLYYLVSSRYRSTDLRPSVRQELHAIEEAADADPRFQARIERLQRRLEELDGDDAEMQFARVTGHRLEAAPTAGKRRASRPPRKRDSRRFRGFALGIAALVVLIAIVGVVERAATQPFADIATVASELPDDMRRPTLRGSITPEEDAMRLRYEYARSLLADSRRSLLGLFVSFDQAKVQEATALLQEAANRADADENLKSAVQVLLARAYLAQGNATGARAVLEEAARGRGAHAEESRRMLDAIDRGHAP